jgi:DNA-damage-inducible protein J
LQGNGFEHDGSFHHFATKVSREQRIPFEIAVDPFYSEANMERLRKAIADVESGKARLTEHELIEEEDD